MNSTARALAGGYATLVLAGNYESIPGAWICRFTVVLASGLAAGERAVARTRRFNTTGPERCPVALGYLLLAGTARRRGNAGRIAIDAVVIVVWCAIARAVGTVRAASGVRVRDTEVSKVARYIGNQPVGCSVGG